MEKIEDSEQNINNPSSVEDAENQCANGDCKNLASKLGCPSCIKLQLPPTYFCSQECFKKAWPTHKKLHVSYQNMYWKPEQSFDGFKFTGDLRPGKVKAMVKVPSHIITPDYAISGMPASEMQAKYDKKITVYNDDEIKIIRECGLLARKALDVGHKMVKVGVTTNEINDVVHDFIIENNAYPSPLNYHGFPKSICTSVNEVICHGIPDDRPLKNGDIINLDITVYYKGYHMDLNETYCVGDVAQEYKD